MIHWFILLRAKFPFNFLSGQPGVKIEKLNGMLPHRQLSCWTSGATALIDDHFGQISLDDVHIWSEVDERHAGEFGRCTARLQVGERVHSAKLFQDVRVVVEESVRRSMGTSAIAAAVIGVIATGGDDPVVPAQSSKADEESLLAASSCGWTTVQCTTTQTSRTGRIRVHH